MIRNFWYLINDYSLEPPLIICTWYVAICKSYGFYLESVDLVMIFFIILFGYTLDRLFEPEGSGYLLTARHQKLKNFKNYLFVLFLPVLILILFLLINYYELKFIISIIIILIFSLNNLYLLRSPCRYFKFLILGKEFHNSMTITIYIIIFIINRNEVSYNIMFLTFIVIFFNMLLISFIDIKSDNEKNFTFLQKNPTILKCILLFLFISPIINLLLLFNPKTTNFFLLILTTFSFSLFFCFNFRSFLGRRVIDTIYWFLPVLYIIINL